MQSWSIYSHALLECIQSDPLSLANAPPQRVLASAHYHNGMTMYGHVVENTSHASTLMVSGWVYLGVVTDQKRVHAKVGVKGRCEVAGLKWQKLFKLWVTLIREVRSTNFVGLSLGRKNSSLLQNHSVVQSILKQTQNCAEKCFDLHPTACSMLQPFMLPAHRTIAQQYGT